MYIGKTPTVGNFQKCDAISVVNGQAAYTLQVSSTNVSPESVNHMIVSLNGIIQAPTTAYTVSGATLTFASNLATGDVIDFVLLLGNVLDVGTPTDNTVATAKIQDDAVTLAKMAAGTDGNIISYDASGNPVAIATGNDGQILTSAGAGQPPAFEAAPGGGKIGQVVSATKTDTFTSNSQTYADVTGMSVAITPAATSSKVLVFAKVSCGQPSGNSLNLQLVRDSTALLIGDAASARTRTSSGVYAHADISAGPIYGTIEVPILYLDSPSTTSSTTYKIQFKQSEDLTGCLNRSGVDTDNSSRPRTASTITVMEVLA